MTFQAGGFKYDAIEAWTRIPEGLEIGEDIPSVATDSQGRVYILNRGPHPVLVFESDGRFVGTWGEGEFPGRPHGITITRDDVVWCTDDLDHTARRFTLDGKLQQVVGTPGKASDTGYNPKSLPSLLSIKRGAGPFNRPTKVVVAANGDLYITDGYGNARVHHLSASGDVIHSWGEPGTEPGQFNLPHSLALSSGGRVYVCDRENFRMQVFSPDGDLLNLWQIHGRPLDMAIDARDNVYISVGRQPADKPNMAGRTLDTLAEAHLLICDLDGKVMARFGQANYGSLDTFVSPHGMCIDNQGNWYVVENGQRLMKRMGLSCPDYPSIRKYARC